MRATRWCGASLAAAMAVVCAGRAAAAGSSVTDVARLRLGADALEAVLRGVLPAEVRLPASFAPAPGAGFNMTDVKYCGVGPKGSARLRAVGALAGSATQPKVVLVCPGLLAELAEQAKPAL